MVRYIETTLNEWFDLFKIDVTLLDSFVFRGQGNSRWDLKTSIERSLISDPLGRRVDGLNTDERWILDHFNRKIHLYSKDYERLAGCKFSGLAKIQHHGGATRLLDFSHSMFVGLYFAMENACLPDDIRQKIEIYNDSSKINNPDNYTSLWMVNHRRLRDEINKEHEIYKKGVDLKDDIRRFFIDFANGFIAKKYNSDQPEKTKTVIPLEVDRFDERTSYQQGMFLMPTDLRFSFMENLWRAFCKGGESPVNPFEKMPFNEFLREMSVKNKGYKEYEDCMKHTSSLCVIKINIPKIFYENIMDYLIKMNVTAEVLFPGIQGLVKSVIHVGSDN
jgi:hypothetical protein